MTTIIYKDGQIATDSYVNDGATITDTDAIKMIDFNGTMFFIAGALCDYNVMVDCFFGNRSEKENVHLHAFVWDGSVLYQCGVSDKEGFWKEYPDISKYHAIGTGDQLSYAALDAGCSLEAACKIASTRDLYSGGEIKVYDLPGYEGK